MNADARRKAERCFAVARSTTFDGERANAIAQGTKIAQAAGLSLDLFDIPGRVKTTTPPPRSTGFRDDLFSRPPPPRYSQREAEATARAFNEAVRRAMDAEFQREVSEAMRRSADLIRKQQEAQRAAKEAADRIARAAKAEQERRQKLERAVVTLERAGSRAWATDTQWRLWSIELRDGVAEVTDADILGLADLLAMRAR